MKSVIELYYNNTYVTDKVIKNATVEDIPYFSLCMVLVEELTQQNMNFNQLREDHRGEVQGIRAF